MNLIGSVDLGGTNIAIGLGTPDGEIKVRASFPTGGNQGPNAVLSHIVAMLQSHLPSGARLSAVGMGVPGRLDAARRVTQFLPNLATQWKRIPVAERLEAVLGCPVYLLNDARLAALGELDFGFGRQYRDFLYFTLGTGIGGAVILNGQLHLGSSGAAGELGHQCVEPNGPLCGCGARGCLEAVASASALTAEGLRLLRIGQAPHLASLLLGNLNDLNLEKMAAAEDAAISQAIERTARYIGQGMANLVTTLQPQAIIFAGGMANLGDRLLAPARAALLDHVRMFPADDVAIRASQLGGDSALLGGIALAAREGKL